LVLKFPILVPYINYRVVDTQCWLCLSQKKHFCYTFTGNDVIPKYNLLSVSVIARNANLKRYIS
jgi:hypothetical protein